MRLLLLPTLVVIASLAGCTGKSLPEACALKPESGMCRAAISRYWFDDSAGMCKEFIWGGCDGVAPFETMEACQSQCMAGQAPAVDARPAAGRGY